VYYPDVVKPLLFQEILLIFVVGYDRYWESILIEEELS